MTKGFIHEPGWSSNEDFEKQDDKTLHLEKSNIGK